MCHILKKRKKERNTDWKTNQNKWSQKRASRSHAHASPSDAPLWINTHSGVGKGNGIKLREARNDKNIGIQSRPLSPEDDSPAFDGCRRRHVLSPGAKHKASYRFSFLRWNLSVPALRRQTEALWHVTFPALWMEYSKCSHPSYLWTYLRKAIWTEVLKVKLGEMEENKKISTFWGVERAGGREREGRQEGERHGGGGGLGFNIGWFF